MRKRRLVLLVISALVLTTLGAAAEGLPGTIRGYVFRDGNQNGVMDAGEEGIPGVFVTVSYGDYQHTYYTGEGDPSGDVPGPGSYGPTPLQTGNWMVKMHVPDGYQATTATELAAFVPDGGAATGINFGLFGTGPISYAAGTGVAMGGAAALPLTGGAGEASAGRMVALILALVGFLTLLGTPWCTVQVKRAYKRWW
jgi:hypothetical protein